VEVVRAQEFLPALLKLQQTGKILHFGVSCASEDVARAALDLPGVACLQVHHSVAHSHIVPSILPYAVRSGVGIVAVAPFGDGSLLGTGDSAGDVEVSDRAKQCLRFCLTTPGVASVLVGMSSREHVAANAEVAFSTQGGPNAEDGPCADRH
jgi:aryl-alcohol dehydrogenase-like predicted oxidoreductase